MKGFDLETHTHIYTFKTEFHFLWSIQRWRKSRPLFKDFMQKEEEQCCGSRGSVSCWFSFPLSSGISNLFCPQKKETRCVHILLDSVTKTGTLRAHMIKINLICNDFSVGKVKRESKNKIDSLEAKNRHLSYSDVVKITNNFERTLGKGGFGTVYYGRLNEIDVAVKMLSSSSAQGFQQFQAEVHK